MSNRGNVMLAWPDIHVVDGRRLEELSAMLAARADEISEEHRTHPGVTLPIMQIAKYAVVDTVKFIEQPMNAQNLRTVIEDCWIRHDQSEEGSGKVRGLLYGMNIVHHAISLLEREGSIAFSNEDRLVRLTPAGFALTESVVQ